MEQLLNEREVAKMLRVSVQLLQKWRAGGTGPIYIKLGKCIRYAASDIERYVSGQRSGRAVVRGDHTQHDAPVQ